jgi:hypothetical protein
MLIRLFRFALTLLLAAGAAGLSPVRAATPEDGAVEAAQAWVKAIIARDVDAQIKLLPDTMYADRAERERKRQQRVRDRELAIINNQKYLSFDLRAPSQTLKVNKMIAVVVPYRSVLATAEGKIQTDSSLIALSPDGSSQWSVFDGSGQVDRSLKSIIPGYTTGLMVPRAVSTVIKGE